MSWDQPVHSFSYPHGEPQTPTRTPMTAALDAFTTPKLESSFFDPRVTWDTADPYASSPDFLRSPHKFGISDPNVVAAELLTATRGRRELAKTDTVRKARQHKQGAVVGEEGPRTVDSAKSASSMQTPPPSSASRRKIPEFEPTGSVGKGATSQVNNHLETPSRLLGMSPRLFGNLQASPDLFQLASMEAARSPFLPQERLFWDSELETAPHGLPTGGPVTQHSRTERESTRSTTHAVIPQLPAIDGYMDLPDFTTQGMGILCSGLSSPLLHLPRIPITKAEDPAMFLSSPARRFGGPHMTPDRRALPRQPYHHQVEESKREELRRALSSGGHRPSSFSSLSEEEEEDDDDDDYTPRGRPGLTRSVTHSAIASSTQQRPSSRSSGFMASTSGIRKSPSKGRISPVKTMRPAPLGRSCSMAARMPTRSQSVVLKIGKDGRAKTEMQPVDEAPTGLTDPLTGMDLEESVTESDVDPAEYSEYPVLSRPSSFSLGLLDGGRSYMSQSDTSSRPPSKGSYSSTVGSSQSGRASPWASSSRAVSTRSTYRGSPEAVKRTPSKRGSSLLFSDASYTRGSTASQTLPGEDEDDGDATHALRQVLRERGRAPRPSLNASFGARLPRANTFTHLRSSPPRLHSDFDVHPTHLANHSPTTLSDPDLTTPITDRHCHSNPSNGTRCVCNSMDNGGHLMIQCESCTHWLHTKCVGLERSNLPSFYVCIFCSHTPSRVQSGYAPGGGPPPSPLAHKSFRTR
ncbi:hypothetical protein N7539_002328 [Penicillium diatomitis]|uniref:PHD-type domain-containing protein n=1 Tax=Penicillium diatomitis TaxID=2819901 RepID=A0A9W9XEI3_9EURO|nr:uncharacterized protein N7539_002328 [Penicillium diatomitis]KAJ5490761.1 hypothetical protein N7539_002328 [Penicillium diatomitis]